MEPQRESNPASNSINIYKKTIARSTNSETMSAIVLFYFSANEFFVISINFRYVLIMYTYSGKANKQILSLAICLAISEHTYTLKLVASSVLNPAKRRILLKRGINSLIFCKLSNKLASRYLIHLPFLHLLFVAV